MKLTTENRRDLRLLALMLAAAGGIAALSWLLLPPERTGDIAAHPSTFFNEPYGTKAAYLVLGELGFVETRLRRPIDEDTLTAIDALVLLEPVECLHPHEEGVLAAWIEQGHRLLVAPAAGDSEIHEHLRTLVEDCVQPADWFHFAPGGAPAGPDGFYRLKPAPAAESPLLAEVNEVRARRTLRFDSNDPLAWPAEDLAWQPILQDERGVAALTAQYGAGEIIAVADVYALTNAGLDEADHAVWLANLAGALAGGDPDAVIAVDEMHHGFPYSAAPWVAMLKLLADERWARGVLQAVVVAALALYAAGRHFGRPEGIAPPSRRSQGEFTAAAGRLMQQAHASDVALAAIWRAHRVRLCRSLHLPAGCRDAELVESLARRGHGEAARAVEEVAAKAGARVPDRTLVELTRRLNNAVETIEHGTGAGR